MRDPFKHVDSADIWAGLIAPIPFVAYGLWCVLTKNALLWGGLASVSGTIHLRSDQAIAVGIAAFAIAAALHMHCIWGRGSRVYGRSHARWKPRR